VWTLAKVLVMLLLPDVASKLSRQTQGFPIHYELVFRKVTHRVMLNSVMSK
jgi:hypothetical protein